MGYFLVEHPNPTCPQWRTPRRAPVSGTVGVHTCEGAMDDVGIDTGAENVASYISTRPDYGSYHVIVDSDSTVDCVPDDYEAWHIAETDAFGMGMNSHSWGVSAACRTTDWDPYEGWTKATIIRMGQAIRAFWTRNGFDPLDPNICRFLTRDEAKRRVPGLVLHGVVQPGDRSDAWRDHPQRAELEAMLIAAITGTPAPIHPTPEQIEEEELMAAKDDIIAATKAEADRVIAAVNAKDDKFQATHAGRGEVYLVTTGVKYHVPGELAPSLPLLEKYMGYENKGVQDALLDALPTGEWDATKF